MLKGKKDIVLPCKTVARLMRWKIVIESKTLATTLTLDKKFVGHNIDSIGIAMSKVKSVPSAKSMERSIVAIWNGLVEGLRIMDRGEDGAIVDDDLFSSNVGLLEELAWVRAQSCGDGQEQ